MSGVAEAPVLPVLELVPLEPVVVLAVGVVSDEPDVLAVEPVPDPAVVPAELPEVEGVVVPVVPLAEAVVSDPLVVPDAPAVVSELPDVGGVVMPVVGLEAVAPVVEPGALACMF